MFTEQQIKEFFQQVIDRVTAEMNALNERIQALENDNRQLRDKLADANTANEHVNALRQAIVERDSRVTSLEAELRSEANGHKITVAQYDKWKQQVGEYVKQVTDLTAKLDRITSIVAPVADLHVVAAS
jgi:predicted RNase H-like nuclease (RuvC/YqgF family)